MPAFSISKTPSFSRLFRVLLRRRAPFVMVNVLKFKEKATGKYSNLTGEEAYSIYARKAMQIQQPMGSKLLWTGRITKQVIGPKTPEFSSVGLLQYAKPTSFFRFVVNREAPTDARYAGLEGQWLLASTTLQHNSNQDKFAVVEFISISDRQHLDEMIGQRQTQGQIIWVGKCDLHILGSSSSKITHCVVTGFSSQEALDKQVSLIDSDKNRGDIRGFHLVFIASTQANGWVE